MITQRDHTVNTTLLLASASPRRRELIRLLGLPVETTAADIDETPLDHERADELAIRLSQEKAQAVHSPSPTVVRRDCLGYHRLTRWRIAGQTDRCRRGPIDVSAPARSSSSSAYGHYDD